MKIGEVIAVIAGIYLLTKVQVPAPAGEGGISIIPLPQMPTILPFPDLASYLPPAITEAPSEVLAKPDWLDALLHPTKPAWVDELQIPFISEGELPDITLPFISELPFIPFPKEPKLKTMAEAIGQRPPLPELELKEIDWAAVHEAAPPMPEFKGMPTLRTPWGGAIFGRPKEEEPEVTEPSLIIKIKGLTD